MRHGPILRNASATAIPTAGRYDLGHGRSINYQKLTSRYFSREEITDRCLSIAPESRSNIFSRVGFT